MVAIYSVINFIVNGISAFSMSAKYGKDSAYAYLFYGLCAYVIPLLIGIVCDVVVSKIKNNTGLIHRRFYWGVTVLGVVFSLLGMYFGLYALGVGSALVTTGAGLGCMHIDSGKSSNVKYIGLFLAVGSPGLWIGNVLADFTSVQVYIQNIWIALMIIMVVIGFMYIIYRERSFQFVAVKQPDDIYTEQNEKIEETGDGRFRPTYILAVAGCMVIAAYSSYMLQAVDFDWRKMLVPSLAAVFATAIGRGLGPFLIGKIKSRKVSVCIAALICVTAIGGFFFKQYMAVGIIELLLVGCLMSGALYFSSYKYRKLRGLSIGMTCLGSFIGFLLFIF